MNRDISEPISDKTETLGDLRQLTKNFVKERDWEKYHYPRALAEAISIEAAELLQVFLFKKENYLPADLTEITYEMADIIIYLLCLANSLKIPNLAQIIHEKMDINRLKYPAELFSGENYEKQ